RAEVALPGHQRIAHGEILRHTHHSIVHALIAMWVIFTQYLTHHTGALLVRPVVAQPQILAHSIDNTPLHWLQAVAHIRQGPVQNGVHGIHQDTAFQVLGKCQLSNSGRRCHTLSFHASVSASRLTGAFAAPVISVCYSLSSSLLEPQACLSLKPA